MTPAQIKASKELYQVMTEKGIEWEPIDDDRFIDVKTGEVVRFYEKWSRTLIKRAYPNAIPFPDIEQCLKLLEGWGYDCFEIPCHWGKEKSWFFRFRKSTPGLDWIEIEAPDLGTCAILACKEVVIKTLTDQELKELLQKGEKARQEVLEKIKGMSERR